MLGSRSLFCRGLQQPAQPVFGRGLVDLRSAVVEGIRLGNQAATMCSLGLLIILSAGTLGAAEPAGEADPVPAEATPATSAPPAPEITPAQLTAWINDLLSEEFADREAATVHLAQAGDVAIPRLLKLAQEGKTEAAIRAVDVLGRMFATGDGDLDHLDEELQKLAAGKRSAIAHRAQWVLENHAEARQARAIKALSRLGAKVKLAPNRSKRSRFPLMIPADEDDAAETKATDEEQPPPRMFVESVMLWKRWQGGDEGLKFVRRLRFDSGDGRRILLRYSPRHAGISREAINDLEQYVQLHGGGDVLIALQRGPARLGIVGEGSDLGVRIRDLDPARDCPALVAGLREGDVITHLGETAVTEFDELVDLIADHDAGDTIDLAVIRGRESFRTKVTLAGW